MRGVKQLSEAVRSSIRSGVILFDVARVVEELVFNSLDACARKVSVFVGIGTCYVKVVDDGCRITRDGLVLLGERYAMSKSGQCFEGDGASGGFVSRGEALASISDVALLEVVTKASGRPNGYRKLMKGSKCLYLGVDDDRKDVGTTVVVRDLFYNQPVRRKCMQSSPKKVLDTVKKCVHRIVLVHSKVSFKVIDIESEDELLRTIPSPSPLTLLRSAFGIEVSDALHELNISDGKLELSGYLSTPCKCLAIKDWIPVHNFIEKAIQSFWKEKISYEPACHGADIRREGQMWEEHDNIVYANENLSEMSPIGKKRRRIQDLETSPDIMKILRKENSVVSQKRHVSIPFDYLHGNIDDVKDRDSEIDFGHDTDYSFKPWDQSGKMYAQNNPKGGNDSWMSDISVSPDKDYMMDSPDAGQTR